MTEANPGQPAVIAQQVMAILETGGKTESYKYALLIALIDEVLENVGPDGSPPTCTRGSRLADRVMAMYWAQTVPIDDLGHPRQSASSRGLVDKAAERRAQIAGAGWLSFDALEQHHPTHADELKRDARTAIRKYAIPRLQKFGTTSVHQSWFLYEPWTEDAQGHGDERGDRLDLLPGVPEALLLLGPLLRQVIEREWLAFVLTRNRGRVEEPRLERALFGANRAALLKVRDPLRDLQSGCYYCGSAAKSYEVDHFLPWSLIRDDSIENLLLACAPCNNAKRTQLVGPTSLDRWWQRLHDHADAFSALAEDLTWPTDVPRTRSRAWGLYYPHVDAGIPLWVGRDLTPTTLTGEQIRDVLLPPEDEDLPP